MVPSPQCNKKKPAKLSENNTTEENTSISDNSDDDDEATIPISELKEILHDELLKQEEKLKAHITEQFVELNAELANTKQIAQDAIMRAEANELKIDTLQSENLVLKQQLNNIKTQEIRQLGEQIEDRTNRQLRNSLAFKGIVEEANETWERTESILVKNIADVTNSTVEIIEPMIERAHRGAHSTKEGVKKSGPRPIHVKFLNWKDCEWVKNEYRLMNIRSGGDIFAQQKFGPLTTARRNQALIMRKELKQQGKIKKAFVKFPAKLMVKTTDDPNERYHLHEDFSKAVILLRN